MASSQMLLGSYSQAQPFGHGLEEEEENHMSSNERDLEQYIAEDNVEFSDELHIHDGETLEMQNEPLMNQEHETEQRDNFVVAPSKGKRTRGPTICKDVQEWTLEDRKPIILNEIGNPIGPDKKTVDKFSRFLGTLARNSFLAPLNKINWHHVDNKEKIWSYMKKKYIIPEVGKDQFLSSFRRIWRKHKCAVKAKYFTAYADDHDKLKHAPDTVLESHFKKLLEFWNLEQVQEDNKKKKEINTNQKDRHTMGPMSFARRQHKLQQLDVEKKPPSQAFMYKKSCKRKAGKIYKTSYEPIQSNIDKMEEVQMQSEIDGDAAYYKVMTKPDNLGHQKKLLGICSIKGKSNMNYVGGPIIPDEFLQPYKDQIVKDTVGEVMKMFNQQLAPEIFDDLTQSLGNVSSIPELTKHLPNAQDSD